MLVARSAVAGYPRLVRRTESRPGRAALVLAGLVLVVLGAWGVIGAWHWTQQAAHTITTYSPAPTAPATPPSTLQ